ncbi:hypothetical protein Hdeb2414_s0006g00211021 [Helianthus debilis subsp. tardiflorus]
MSFFQSITNNQHLNVNAHVLSYCWCADLIPSSFSSVIASSSSLRKIATHYGVSFVPLFSALIKKQKVHAEGSAFGWKGLSGFLYTVSSWAEVHSFIIGS